MSMADAPSFEKIDYSLRPAKSTERWMLIEALARLSVFHHLPSYQYVGFGSPFFVDIRLFHRRLAITRLLSIENKVDLADRFKLNKPYDCVDMLWGEASDRLLEIDWAVPTITWLDYDDRLSQSMLGDAGIVADRAKHGDCLLVTVDADPPLDGDEVEDIRRELGSMAGSISSARSLVGWSLATIFYDLIHSSLIRAVNARGDGLSWIQLFRFHYRDSARMLTYGGIFVDAKQRDMVDAAGFADLPFVVMDDEEPFVIQMPQLTHLETARIDRHMPDDVDAAVAALAEFGIAESQVRRYARIYRHGPKFHESQV